MKRNEILDSVKEYAQRELPNGVFIPGVSPVPASGPVLYPEDVMAVVDTALQFWYTDWKKCAKFKRELKRITDKKYCILTNSGSSASLIAVTALLKRSQGKYVITTALGFPTTIYPIWQNGKVPIFIDIDPCKLTPNYEQFEKYINSSDVAGSIFAHTLGFPFVEQQYYRKEKFLLSDCCDGLGSEYYVAKEINPIHVGKYADAMTLSFFPAHHITSAEGGAVLTDDEESAKEMERLSNWGRDCYCLPGQSNTCGHRFTQDFPSLPKGWDHKYTFTSLGYNLKMTEFQAALGTSQLKHLTKFKIRRIENCLLLFRELGTYNKFFDFVSVSNWSLPNPFGFPIIVRKEAPFTAQELIVYLEKHKISTRRLFGGNLTRQPFIKDLPYITDDLTNTNFLMENAFWVGCHPQLTQEHIYYIIDTISDFLGKLSA
jgi:CDP-6-deoxy-D-xylo-4-hexulose-3-dehydrase